MSNEAILITAAESSEAKDLITFLRHKYPDHHTILSDAHPVQPNTVALDVRETSALKQLLQDNKITTIMHLESLRAGDTFSSWDTHMQSLLNLLDTASACGVRRIHWALPITTKGTIQEIISVSGRLWCKWYGKKYNIDVMAFDVRHFELP